MWFKILLILNLMVFCLAGPTQRPSNSRIVGGEDAAIAQFPYIISIRHFPSMSHVCGGAIFREHWIVTATHCMVGFTPATTRIVAGTVLLTGDSNAVVNLVDRLVLHPEHNSKDYDMGLIRVVNPFVWTRYVQPIRLGFEFYGAGLDAVAMGWGATRQDATGGAPNHLQWINTRTLTESECMNTFGFDFVLCTFAEVGRGICFGDSGGPLVIGNAVVGVASWVFPCAIGLPDGWDRLSYFHNWILTNSVD